MKKLIPVLSWEQAQKIEDTKDIKAFTNAWNTDQEELVPIWFAVKKSGQVQVMKNPRSLRVMLTES